MAQAMADLPETTPLHDAALLGDAIAVAALLVGGADPEARVTCDSYTAGATALHFASREGYPEVITALLEAGARPNGRPPGGDFNEFDELDSTPLHEAAAAGNAQVVERLLAGGALCDPLVSGPYYPMGTSGEDMHMETGVSPLHLAAYYGHVEVVRVLAWDGATLDRQTGISQYFLLLLATAEDHYEAVDALLELGANVGAQDYVERTALHLASSLPVLCILLVGGAEVDARMEHDDIECGTALFRICATTYGTDLKNKIRKATQMIKLLIRYGAEFVDICGGMAGSSDLFGPPLSCAAQNNVLDIASTLIDCGVGPNEQTDEVDGPLPLHHAVESGHLEFSRLLLRAGADPNARRGWGEGGTPLHVACRHMRVECVKELVRWGADMEQPERRDGGGRLPSGVVGQGDVGYYENVSRDEDEEVAPYIGEGAAKHVRDCNIVRHALRAEGRWRRRRSAVLIIAHLTKPVATDSGSCDGDAVEEAEAFRSVMGKLVDLASAQTDVYRNIVKWL